MYAEQSPNDPEEYSEAVMHPLEIIVHAPDIMTTKPFLLGFRFYNRDRAGSNQPDRLRSQTATMNFQNVSMCYMSLLCPNCPICFVDMIRVNEYSVKSNKTAMRHS